MNAVIKAAATNGSVRPFSIPPRISLCTSPEADSIEPPEDLQPLLEPAIDEEKEALRIEVERLQLALDAADQALAAAEASSLEEQRHAALKLSRDAETKRLAALEKGIADLAKAWDERLAMLDGLAVAVARSALSKLFDSREDDAEFLARTIARQLKLVRRETVLAIRVSAKDFPDDRSLTAFASRAGTGAVRLVADPDLDAGACRADLQLGHLDLGASTQQAQLLSLLDELAVDGAVA